MCERNEFEYGAFAIADSIGDVGRSSGAIFEEVNVVCMEILSVVVSFWRSAATESVVARVEETSRRSRTRSPSVLGRLSASSPGSWACRSMVCVRGSWFSDFIAVRVRRQSAWCSGGSSVMSNLFPSFDVHLYSLRTGLLSLICLLHRFTIGSG